MNAEKKKRINIGIDSDVLEKLERINQDEYYGHMKIKNIMLSIIDIGLLAVDCFGTCRKATIALEQYAVVEEQERQEQEHNQEEEQEEPVLEKILELMGNPGENGTVLESPIGKLLVAPRPVDQQVSDLNRQWTLEDFEGVIEEKNLEEGYRVAAFECSGSCWSDKLQNNTYWNRALIYRHNDGVRRFREINYSGINDYTDERDKVTISPVYGKQRRYRYHRFNTKLIPWRELFPEAKPWPWEKKYLTEAAPGSQAEGA